MTSRTSTDVTPTYAWYHRMVAKHSGAPADKQINE